jgi:hypothetical protein
MAGRAYSVLRDRTVCGNAPQDRWVFVLRFTAFRIHIGIEAHSGRFSGPFDKSAPARFRSGTKARISAFGWDDLPTMREAHEAHHPYVSLCAVPADRHHLYDHPDVQAVPAAGLVVDREMRKKGAISFKSAQDRKMIVRRISAWLGLKGVPKNCGRSPRRWISISLPAHFTAAMSLISNRSGENVGFPISQEYGDKCWKRSNRTFTK